MENSTKYLSKTVAALVDENHPLSEKLKKIECTFCTQSVWSLIEGGRDDKDVELFCLKTHTLKWAGGKQPLITRCDGFTNQPLTDE